MNLNISFISYCFWSVYPLLQCATVKAFKERTMSLNHASSHKLVQRRKDCSNSLHHKREKGDWTIKYA